ncbi:MAG: hypothetical protein K6E50_14815 [Lachnospiraceae bacterium]|nr:hypothetical protein [Lachnospiraceae bacterium]
MPLSIISIVINTLFFIIMNIDLYTDRFTLPDEGLRVWKSSPIDRLDVAGNRFPLYLFLFFGIISIVSSVLFLFGLKHNAVKTIRLISTIASALMFIIVMIYSATVHPNY